MAGSMCVDQCNEALTYVKGKGTAYASLAKIMEDCADLCDLRQKFENRNSPLFEQIKALCAKACERCAAACEEMKDENLKKCIDECRSCAATCA